MRFWEIQLALIDPVPLRAILDARFAGYNLAEVYAKSSLQTLLVPGWKISVLSDEAGVEQCVEEIRALTSGLVEFGPDKSEVTLLREDGGVEPSDERWLYQIFTEDTNREGMMDILTHCGLDGGVIMTQGAYQGVKEFSATIFVWSMDRADVLKVATQIGTMNRQKEMLLKHGDDVEFIQTWHEHTVAGSSVERQP